MVRPTGEIGSNASQQGGIRILTSLIDEVVCSSAVATRDPRASIRQAVMGILVSGHGGLDWKQH